MATSASFGPRPTRHPAGLAAVVALHGVLVWALVQTLGQRWVELDLPSLVVDILRPPPAPPAPVAPPAPPAPPPDLSHPARLEASRCDCPEYPRAARRAEATGTTRIRFQVDAAGRVVDAGRLCHRRVRVEAAGVRRGSAALSGGRRAVRRGKPPAPPSGAAG